ncbi:MAG: pentapeptide repeat-containing protein, partial [Thermomicrobiales bacterium]
LPELVGAVDAARRSGPIEAWLAAGGDPERFIEVRHRFDLRDEARPGVHWDGLDLGADDLGGFDLRGATLTGCVLPDISAADLSGAMLDRSVALHARGAVFDEASLLEVDIECGRLDGASFRGASLRGANLCGAGLRRAAFHGADLTGADLGDTDLTGSTIHLARSLTGCYLGGAFGLNLQQIDSCRALGALGLVPAFDAMGM